MLATLSKSQLGFRYQENGHIIKPWGVPGKLISGTVSVYGTLFSSLNDKLLGIHGVWDGQSIISYCEGRLFLRETFDDGRCYETNNSPIFRDRQ
jgi:hypothetical protein